MTTVRENSLAAYRAGQLGLFGKRELEIIQAFEHIGAATDRAVLAWCNYTDMNAVRPRITELIACGLLEERGSAICPVTHKSVRICRIMPNDSQTELFFA